MKRASRKMPAPRSFVLKQRKGLHSRLIEFPNVKGRTVEKVEFLTMADSHSITIRFQDKLALVLNIVPGFTLESSIEDHNPDPLRVIKRWPDIPSQP